MKTDWDSLFFSYHPHADQRPHEDHLLADVGLTRTVDGGLALAEDPTHRVDLGRPSPAQRAKALFQRGFNRLFNGDGAVFVRF
jgi:hypothetical protein